MRRVENEIHNKSLSLIRNFMVYYLECCLTTNENERMPKQTVHTEYKHVWNMQNKTIQAVSYEMRMEKGDSDDDGGSGKKRRKGMFKEKDAVVWWYNKCGKAIRGTRKRTRDEYRFLFTLVFPSSLQLIQSSPPSRCTLCRQLFCPNALSWLSS